jgi:hypothetical protein
MTAGNSSQVKQRIRNGGAYKNCYKPISLHIIENEYFCFLNKSQILLLFEMLDLAYLLILQLLLS